MWSFTPILPELYTRLLERKTVKKLGIYENGLPAIGSINETLEDLRVIYYWKHGSFQTLKWQTLSKLKGLKHLDIVFPELEIEDIIANCSGLDQLMTLKLTKFSTFARELDAFQAINLPGLKEIHFTNISVSQRDWASITTNCPLVEKLTLDRFVMDAESANLICETWNNLKVLDLGYGIYSAELFPALLKCSSLEELRVSGNMKQQMEARLDLEMGGIPFKITEFDAGYMEPLNRMFINNNARMVGRSLLLDNITA
jgi:hypothetical protein